jgi:hypothetical protein
VDRTALAALAALAVGGDADRRQGRPGAERITAADRSEHGDAVFLAAVRAVDRSVRDRLLDALAPIVAAVDDVPVPAVAALLPEPRQSFAMVSCPRADARAGRL